MLTPAGGLPTLNSAEPGLPPFDTVSPAISVRRNQMSSKRQVRQIVQSQLNLDDYLP